MIRKFVQLVLALLVLGGSQLVSADVTGKVLGTVADAAGAVVPNAKVTLANAQTGWTRSVKTDAQGRYQFLAVPTGAGYGIEVEATGFQKTVRTSFTLLVNQDYRADFDLKVGSIQQIVVVSAETSQVETTSTQLGDVIGSQKMTDLPLNGRSYVDLVGLQPGVVPITSGASGQGTSVSGNLSAGILSVNGAREDANQYLVNGADVEESTYNGAAVIPSLDSIEEFRVLTNSYDAEYGRFAGGIVNVITKSGSNGFHGTAYEFLRNDVLDAHNYFDPAGTPKGTFKRNQFGFAAGGPVIKNRAFFFSDYQGTREILGVSDFTHVPSSLERGGDFSDVGTTGFAALTGTVQGNNNPGSFSQTLTQRLGYTVNPGEPYWAPGCTTSAQAQAGVCVFPGQVIPQTAWSPAAMGTQKFIPMPNGTQNGTPFFATSAFNQRTRDDKFGQRVDLNSNSIGRWSLYYGFDDASVLAPYCPCAGATGNVPGFGAQIPTRAQNASIRNTYSFGPSAVNEAQLSFTRTSSKPTPQGGLGKVSSFGFVEGGLGIVPASPPALEGMPEIGIVNTGIDMGALNSASRNALNTYQVFDNYSRIAGHHTFKIGGDFRVYQLNVNALAFSNGYFAFQGTETGNDFADYLLGAPTFYLEISPVSVNARTRYIGLYGQDSYQVTPSLTVNYGLRWDINRPWSDTKNRFQSFVPGTQSTRFPGAPLGWVFAGDPGIPSTLAPTRYHDFAPRLGIAYSPNSTGGLAAKLFGGPGKTSIHAGAGIYYTALADSYQQLESGNAPYVITYQGFVPTYFEEPFKNRVGGQDPGQRFPYVQPSGGNSVNWAQFQPLVGQPGFRTNNVVPYVEQFNFNIQRGLGGSSILMLGYVGSAGRHLLNTGEVNPGNAALCLATPGCGPFGEDAIYQISPTQTVYGTRPYSVTSGRLLNQGILDFGELTDIGTEGSSHYNSFQASLQKQVGSLRFLSSYTWSKSMDNISGLFGWFQGTSLNPFNPKLSRGLSSFNMTHNFVTSYAYDLPFQKLRGTSAGPAHKILSGWQLSGITRFTTGLPVVILEGDDRALCGICGFEAPNYSGQPLKFYNPRKTGGLFFSTQQFSVVPLGQFGTARHRFFSGPGLNNWDLALQKMTGITETKSLEFRAEFFNVFNHAQFTNPGGRIDTPTTFGVVTSARPGRIGQVALKLKF